MTLYRPILATEFRVVHLLPGAFDDEIRCVLETRACKVKTQYEALSYEWGAESLANQTLQLAHLQRQDQKPSILTNDKAEPRGTIVARDLWGRFDTVRLLGLQYYGSLRLDLATLSMLFLFQLLPVLFLQSPKFYMWMIPQNWIIAYMGAFYGYVSVIVCEKTVLLVAEVMETKPWSLFTALPIYLSPNKHFETSGTFAWETIPATPNLERALRYLRLENQLRTLWIDALCINQQDDNEKKVQIQRMDFLYANASRVRIWLGDYHSIGGSASCPSLKTSDSLAGPCPHAREISEAFRFMRAANGRRALIPSFLRGRSLEQYMEDTMPGLLAIARSGYWKRLWVVQEAALGTGPITMQCGHEVCDLEAFLSAQHRVVVRNNVPNEVSEAFECGRRFAVTWQEFRYSPFHDHRLYGASERLLRTTIKSAMSYMRPTLELELTSFHEWPYSRRLQCVLLRASGYFLCRDERDRLYALLGVVGGCEKGNRQMANAVEFFGSQPFRMMFMLIIDYWVKFKLGDSTKSVVLRVFLGCLSGSWGIFFDAKAIYWTFSKPRYIVTNHTHHDKLLQRIGKASIGPSQGIDGDFFHLLAQFLAEETKSLAFLDAVSFDEQIANTASWVPRWQAKVDDEVYKFSTARQDGDDIPGDTFRLLDNGKTLEILGMEYGQVSELPDVQASVSDANLGQHELDKIFPLVSKLHKILTILCQRFRAPEPIPKLFIPQNEHELDKVFAILSKHSKAVLRLRNDLPSSGPAGNRPTSPDELRILINVKAALEVLIGQLARQGRKVLYYSSGNKSIGCSNGISNRGSGSSGTSELALLKAGEPKEADKVVFVPGCYHQLVLREVTRTTGDLRSRWKLVGLVITASIAMHGRKNGGVAQTKFIRAVCHRLDPRLGGSLAFLSCIPGERGNKIRRGINHNRFPVTHFCWE